MLTAGRSYPCPHARAFVRNHTHEQHDRYAQANPPSETEKQMVADFDKLTTERVAPRTNRFAQPQFMARRDEQHMHGQREQFILRMLLRYSVIYFEFHLSLCLCVGCSNRQVIVWVSLSMRAPRVGDTLCQEHLFPCILV